MARLRMPVCATVSTGAAFRAAALASAGVILSAICAMMVPRPIMKAAKIIRLRITPHSKQDPQYHHIRAQAATSSGGEGCHFDEKDEGSVNGTSSPLPSFTGERG